ncbi:MAG: von Willebrand factor type A domain-containing protein, partial [Pseudomonadota bacterium]
MTNEHGDLEHLSNALKRATPAPSEEARSQALARAMENFERRVQEKEDPTRPMKDRMAKASGFFKGAIKMFDHVTARPVLIGTTSVAALVVAFGVTQNLQHIDLTTPKNRAVQPEAASTETLSKSRQRLSETLAGQAGERPEILPGLTSKPSTSNDVASAPAPAPSGFTGRPAGAVQQFGKVQATQGLTVQNRPAAERAVQLPAIERPIRDTTTNREQFPDIDQNAMKSVTQEPVSTFSIDVDTASYSYVRSALNAGQWPHPDAVRVEELINYFDYDYPAPTTSDVPFSTSVSIMETPWNVDTKLMHIGIQGYAVPLAEVPPLNLVFLIDTSGSMQDQNKLPLLKQSFRLLLSTLRPEDKIAIVTYAGSAGVALKPTAAADKQAILQALDTLGASGSTAGHAGLKQAYDMADGMADDGEKARIILATDGDFNVGLSGPDEMKRFVAEKRKTGT